MNAIILGHLVSDARKKFNWGATIATVVFLTCIALPILLTVFVSATWLFLIVLTGAIAWGIGAYFNHSEDLDVICRNYSFTEVVKPKTYSGKQLLETLEKLFCDYNTELSLVCQPDELFNETMTFIQVSNAEIQTLESDSKIDIYHRKLLKLLKSCEQAREKAKLERLEMLGRRTSTDVVDSALELASKE